MITNKRKNKANKHHRGFTLMEVLIVLAILTMLGSFVGVAVIGKFKGAKIDTAKIQIANYNQALQAYYLDNNVYPHTTQGLEALIRKPSVGKVPSGYREGTYFGKKELTKDPWGNPYGYTCDDYQNPSITSAGPDGEAGTDDDIKGE